MALTKITSDVIGTGAITSDKLASGAVSASSLSSITTDNVSEGSTNTYFTNARARGSISVTGGNLSYDSGTGVIQLTTDQIRTAVSGGTGVSISAGEISIGQDVATSSTPTFGNITTTGYIAGPATFTIDPAAVGDNTGTVVIAGNLQVDGTTTTINSTTMEVDDLNITLASGAANAAAANGAGITVDGASATITYDGTNDTWEFNKELRLTTGSFASHVNGNRYIKYRSTYDSAIVADFELKSDNNSAAVARITSTGTADVLQVFDNTTQVVTIADGGNVGIGTSGPDTLLQLNAVQAGPVLRLSRQDGSVLANDSYGKIEFYTTDVTNTGVGGYIDVQAESGSAYSSMIFGTGLAGSADEKVRIASNGRVGINQPSPSKLLHVQSDTDYEGIIIKGAGHKQLTIESTSSSRQALTTFQTGSQNMSIGLDTDNAFIFHSGTASSERMQIDSSGNLLVNQTSAGVNGKLQVTGGIGLTGNSEIRQSTNLDGSTLRFLGTQFVAGSSNAVGYSYSSGAQIASVSNSANVLLFEAGASNTSGHRLTIQNDATGLQGEVKYAGSEPVFILRDTRSAGGTAWSDSANEPLGEIEFWTSDATGIGPHAVARIRTVNDITAASPAGAITFMTSGYNNGSPTEKMRISSSGRLLVDTTSIGNASTNAKVVCDSEFLARGSSAGYFWENRTGMTIASQSGWGGWYSTGSSVHYLYSDGANRASIGRTSGTYTALSDVNKKKDFEDSTVGLAEVMQLKPKKFRMLEDADDAPKKLGFVAQDVENVIPEAYVEDLADDENEETFIGLTDRPIIAALTKAIQEQQTIIEDLTARITELEG